MFCFTDDYLIVAQNFHVCERHVGYGKHCAKLGVPLPQVKTVGPAAGLTFLATRFGQANTFFTFCEAAWN